MALTNEQSIPDRPVVKEPWTVRRLFPLSVITSISKVFTNPLEILLAFLIIVLGIAELIGRHVSWFYFVLTILILTANVLKSYRREEKK